MEARTDYESTINNDPIELLRAVKEHSLNYQGSRYEMSIITDAFRAFFNCHQKNNETIQEYTKRFKVWKEILQSHLGGAIVLQKFIQSMPGYIKGDEENEKTCQIAADEQLTTYLFLVNADQEKYGSVMKGLNSQKSSK